MDFGNLFTKRSSVPVNIHFWICFPTGILSRYSSGQLLKSSKLTTVAALALGEFKEVIEGKDEQLVEAYSHFSKRKIKGIIAGYDTMIGVLNSYQALKIKNRARRKTKPITPEKATQKLKYQKAFECDATKLKLESIRPAELHLSKEAWCYDTAKRKLHHYIADDMTDFHALIGTEVAFRFLMSSQSCDLSASLDSANTALTYGNTEFYFRGKIEAILVNPALTDATTATVTLSAQSDFFGPATLP